MSLYPYRKSFVNPELMQSLQDKLTSTSDHSVLTPIEFEEITHWEDALATELSKLHKVQLKKSILYMEYFLTEEGRERFKKLFGVESPKTQEEIFQYIRSHLTPIRELPPKDRTALEGDTRNHMSSTIMDKINSSNSIDILKESNAPQRIMFLVSPDKVAKSIEDLRQFKKKLQEEYNTLKSNPDVSQVHHVQMQILNMYAKKVNELIADKMPYTLLQTEDRSSDERIRMTSKYDKFNHGVTDRINDDGDYIQVLHDMFQEKAPQVQDTDSLKESIKQKGYDAEKVLALTISPEEAADYGEELLKMYGLLSTSPRSEYNPDRTEPAPDGKWQVVVVDHLKSHEVDKKQQVIKVPNSQKNIYSVITVLLAHEIEGHVTQTVNQKKLPLKIFQSPGSDRTSVFAEGGAMFLQNKVSETLFGNKITAQPFYYQAMINKEAQGGNYMDVLHTMLSEMSENDRNNLQVPAVQSTMRKRLSSALRLYRNEEDLSNTSNNISSTKDTVYLEQEILLEELSKYGLEKLAFIGGLNLENMKLLLELGIFSPKNIEEPKLHVYKIWNNIKHNYLA